MQKIIEQAAKKMNEEQRSYLLAIFGKIQGILKALYSDGFVLNIEGVTEACDPSNNRISDENELVSFWWTTTIDGIPDSMENLQTFKETLADFTEMPEEDWTPATSRKIEELYETMKLIENQPSLSQLNSFSITESTIEKVFAVCINGTDYKEF